MTAFYTVLVVVLFYFKTEFPFFLLQNNNTAIVVGITISTAIRIIIVSLEALQIVLIVEIIGLCCPTL